LNNYAKIGYKENNHKLPYLGSVKRGRRGWRRWERREGEEERWRREAEERVGMVLAAESNDLERDPPRHAISLILLCAEMGPEIRGSGSARGRS